MVLPRGIYRLAALDGTPHPVLDAPYESIDAAIGAAKNWSNGQGINTSLGQRAIGIEVKTRSGSWRTIRYLANSLSSSFRN